MTDYKSGFVSIGKGVIDAPGDEHDGKPFEAFTWTPTPDMTFSVEDLQLDTKGPVPVSEIFGRLVETWQMQAMDLADSEAAGALETAVPEEVEGSVYNELARGLIGYDAAIAKMDRVGVKHSHEALGWLERIRLDESDD